MRKTHDQGWVAIGDGIVIGGRISFSRFEEFAEMRQDIQAALSYENIIDIRSLEFISSSGIGVMAMICKRCQQMHAKPVQFFVNPGLEWQIRMAKNLRKIWSGLELIGVPDEPACEFLP